MKFRFSSAVAASLIATFAFGHAKQTLSARRYHAYRLVCSTPTYGLARVRAIIRKLPKPDETTAGMPTPIWSKLSIAERFTYTMIYREHWDQNCAEMPEIATEEDKIFAELPAMDDELMWSDRQVDFLKHNRAKVVALMRNTMTGEKHVGLNIKSAIVQIEAIELIPELEAAFQRNPRDLDLLTTLSVLMKDGPYRPYLSTPTYDALYGPSKDYQSFMPWTRSAQQAILSDARAFYRSKHQA